MDIKDMNKKRTIYFVEGLPGSGKTTISNKGVLWTNRVAELISKTPYGLAHNLHGFDGMVEYFTVRKHIEEKVLLHGIMKSSDYLVENNNWDQIREQIRNEIHQ